jgi:hypothetical protein
MFRDQRGSYGWGIEMVVGLDVVRFFVRNSIDGR